MAAQLFLLARFHKLNFIILQRRFSSLYKIRFSVEIIFMRTLNNNILYLVCEERKLCPKGNVIKDLLQFYVVLNGLVLREDNGVLLKVAVKTNSISKMAYIISITSYR